MSDKNQSRVQEFGYRVPRFPADFHLLLQISDPNPRIVDARCIDISADGLAVKMTETLSVGTRVTLIITLPGNSETLHIAGRVSHQHLGEHGFAFIFSSQRERECVQKYVARFRVGTVGLHRPPQ